MSERLDKVTMRNWALLAVGILNVDDEYAIDPIWESQLIDFTSYFFPDWKMKRAKGRIPKDKGKAFELINNPGFVEFAKNHTINAAKNVFGVSYTTATAAYKAIGIKKRKNRNGTVAQVLEPMIESGQLMRELNSMPMYEFAEKYGFHVSAVWHFLQKKGIKRDLKK